MNINNLDISDKSSWVTITPTPIAKTFPMYFTEIGKFYAGGEYFTKRSNFDSFLMIYSIAGSGYLETDNAKYDVSENIATIIDCNKYHIYKSKDGKPWTFFWVHINGDGLNGLLNAVNIDTPIKIQESIKFEKIFNELINNTHNSDNKTFAHISIKLNELINLILYSTNVTNIETSKKNQSDAVELTIKYIEENYKDQISDEDMMKQVHISKYYFIRIFKQYIGMTPYNYLMNYRINCSKILLRTTNLNISQICEQVGFLDDSNFIYQFKRHTDKKPTEYRNAFIGNGTM
ncbi:MAG: AraC family transcriptional regulator [Oscillospiraceae bacterium]